MKLFQFDKKVWDNDETSHTWQFGVFNKGKMTNIRITKGAARYGRFSRFRDWLYHRAPWLPSWVTGWAVFRYRRPAKPFPDAL
jgi:hypothetical protein